jgi:MerR family mercuric resistance operon transcriptional regulator
MTIGKLAKESEVNVETIRYYERRGLIKQPAERRGAFRIYSSETAARVRSIKRAQSLGFSLKEIKELMTLRLDERAMCCDVLVQTEKKIAEIDEKLRSLRSVKRQLTRLASACREEAPVSECPILEAFDGGS